MKKPNVLPLQQGIYQQQQHQQHQHHHQQQQPQYRVQHAGSVYEAPPGTDLAASK
jgi:transcription initiation factor TFIID subunit TAF12